MPAGGIHALRPVPACRRTGGGVDIWQHGDVARALPQTACVEHAPRQPESGRQRQVPAPAGVLAPVGKVRPQFFSKCARARPRTVGRPACSSRNLIGVARECTNQCRPVMEEGRRAALPVDQGRGWGAEHGQWWRGVGRRQREAARQSPGASPGMLAGRGREARMQQAAQTGPHLLARSLCRPTAAEGPHTRQSARRRARGHRAHPLLRRPRPPLMAPCCDQSGRAGCSCRCPCGQAGCHQRRQW